MIPAIEFQNYLVTSTRDFEFVQLSLKAYIRVGCISCAPYGLKGLLVIYVSYGHDISTSDRYGS